MITGAIKMPGVVRRGGGHQSAAVHYKRPVSSSVCTQHHFAWEQLVEGRKEISIKMEARILTVFFTLYFCSFGAVFSARTHRYSSHLERTISHRNLSTNHRSRYPQYMMQLYRSFKATDSSSSPPVDVFTSQSDKSIVHGFDSILSLVAKGKCGCVLCRWSTVLVFLLSALSSSSSLAGVLSVLSDPPSLQPCKCQNAYSTLKACSVLCGVLVY